MNRNDNVDRPTIRSANFGNQTMLRLFCRQKNHTEIWSTTISIFHRSSELLSESIGKFPFSFVCPIEKRSFLSFRLRFSSTPKKNFRRLEYVVTVLFLIRSFLFSSSQLLRLNGRGGCASELSRNEVAKLQMWKVSRQTTQCLMLWAIRRACIFFPKKFRVFLRVIRKELAFECSDARSWAWSDVGWAVQLKRFSIQQQAVAHCHFVPGSLLSILLAVGSCRNRYNGSSPWSIAFTKKPINLRFRWTVQIFQRHSAP